MEVKDVLKCNIMGFLGFISIALGFIAEATNLKVSKNSKI